MLDLVEKIVRLVARIDRLDIQFDVFVRGQVGGALEIFDEYLFSRGAIAVVDIAGEAMNGAGADGCHVVERFVERFFPVLLAAGLGAKAEFTVAAGRRVDAEHLKLVALDRALEVGGRHAIGKPPLDRLEAAGRRRVDALQQRTVREQIAEMGGKTGHGEAFQKRNTFSATCISVRGRID